MEAAKLEIGNWKSKTNNSNDEMVIKQVQDHFASHFDKTKTKTKIKTIFSLKEMTFAILAEEHKFQHWTQHFR